MPKYATYLVWLLLAGTVSVAAVTACTFLRMDQPSVFAAPGPEAPAGAAVPIGGQGPPPPAAATRPAAPTGASWGQDLMTLLNSVLIVYTMVDRRFVHRKVNAGNA